MKKAFLNKSKRRCMRVVVVTLLAVLQPGLLVQAKPLSENRPSPDSPYHAVFHNSVVIDATPEAIWPQLIDLGSWIEFDFIHESGPVLGEGEIYRLYEGQEFFMEVTKMIPNELLVAVNLPSYFREEESTGIGVFTLTGIGDQTVVNVTMSRQYTWRGEGENPSQIQRESEKFREQIRAAWDEVYFVNLKNNVAHALANAAAQN